MSNRRRSNEEPIRLWNIRGPGLGPKGVPFAGTLVELAAFLVRLKMKGIEAAAMEVRS